MAKEKRKRKRKRRKKRNKKRGNIKRKKKKPKIMEVKKIAEEWCYNSNLEVLRQENNLV